MPPFARASELDRLFACYGSLVLPHAVDYGSAAAEWGTAVHSWVETGVVPEGKGIKIPIETRIERSKIHRETWWPAEGEREVSYALNLVTGMVVRAPATPIGLGRKEYIASWKAAFDSEWVVGTLDFAMELIDRPWVDDLKTGAYVTWGKFAAQQTFYCYVYSKHRYGELRETRSTVTQWKKYPAHGLPRRTGTLLGVDDLTRFVIDLAQLRTTVLGRRGAVSPEELSLGDHCMFCPSRSYCPKYLRNKNDRA